MDSHYLLVQASRNQVKTNRRAKLRAATRFRYVVDHRPGNPAKSNLRVYRDRSGASI
jgi:hypothetical protein